MEDLENGQEDNGSRSGEEEERTTCVSVKESLESARDHTFEEAVSENHTLCGSICSSSALEYLDENIYLKKKIISSLEEIKKIKARNIDLGKENMILKE